MITEITEANSIEKIKEKRLAVAKDDTVSTIGFVKRHPTDG
jgi:hypothetical protein